MQNNILLKVASRALLVGLEEIPIAGAIIKMGRECWQVLRDAQEQASEEERIAQLENAAVITPEEARNIAQEVVMEMRNAGQQIDTARAEAVQDIVAVMPAQIHERTRATLSHARRLGTQAVAALPVTNRFSNTEREAFYSNLFPQRRPQFRSGNALLHGSRGWRLERLIGSGGFGEVWLARKESLAWAVKFCQDEASAALLKHESKTLNELQQKLPAGTSHIAALLDLQLDEKPYWLAFEYVDGGTLESRIRLGPMDWPTAWNLFKPILKGMVLVHDLNIVHRDLKPANILLDRNQQPRIADFGIGKIMAAQVANMQQAQRSQSMTTRGYGSVGYMSPEQAKGDPAHPADDVYALGVILWQMVMGTVQQVPEFPDDIASLAVPNVIKLMLTKCRFYKREKRPQTARALVELLKQPAQAKTVVQVPTATPSQLPTQSSPPSNPTAPLLPLPPLTGTSTVAFASNMEAIIAEAKRKQLEKEELKRQENEIKRQEDERKAQEQAQKDELKRQEDEHSAPMRADYNRILELIKDCPDAVAEQRLAWEQFLLAYPLEQLWTGVEKKLRNTATLILKNETIVHGHYFICPDGTVTDVRTHLMWKRCSEGQTWDGKTCVGKAKEMTWDEIMPNEKQKSWPKFAGHDDWRVPTLEELKTLVYCSSGKPKDWNDTGKKCEGDYTMPTIDQTAFPNTPATGFWSASAHASVSGYAWYLFFNFGFDLGSPRSSAGQVRLVRGGQ